MSLNKVMLIGHLGKDPEVRYPSEGNAMARFSLATNEFYVDKEGQRQTHTEWHNIIAWRRLAELSEKYLKKGRQVYVEGRIRTREYQDEKGESRRITEIVADDIQFLDTRPEG